MHIRLLVTLQEEIAVCALTILFYVHTTSTCKQQLLRIAMYSLSTLYIMPQWCARVRIVYIANDGGDVNSDSLDLEMQIEHHIQACNYAYVSNNVSEKCTRKRLLE